LEIGQFKVNGWAGILLKYPINLRKLTKEERRKKGGVRKERRRKGRTKQLKKEITREIKRKCKKKAEKGSK
jgi:hypothetical protein